MNNNDYRDPPHGCARLILFIFACLIIAVICMLTSCSTTREVPVEIIKKETEYKDRIVYDSIYTLDSVFVVSKGDTIYSTKYKYIYKYKSLIDTAYIERIDSVPYTVEVAKEVNRLTKWQRWQISGFWGFIGILGVIIFFRMKRLFI